MLVLVLVIDLVIVIVIVIGFHSRGRRNFLGSNLSDSSYTICLATGGAEALRAPV